MVVKSVIMLALYFVPFGVILAGVASSHLLLFYALWSLMGIGIVGIGASIMHDSNHGSYSHNKLANRIMGDVLNLLGGYALNWRIQHNTLHHTYTNLEGLDQDIDAGIMIRMSPDKERLPFHRYQHLYAWLLYALMNVYWITAKDYIMLFRYERNELLSNQRITLRKALIQLTLIKIFYFAYIIGLPLLFSGVGWYHIIGGIILMHLIAGFSLACVFQPAHVVATSTFPVPNAEHRIEDSWAIHQILNTADFAPNNKFVCWFIGGLNFQIEHHLFPHVCHIHYPALSAIVKRTAKEFGLPYVVMPTFRSAIAQHARMLRALGREERPALQIVNSN